MINVLVVLLIFAGVGVTMLAVNKLEDNYNLREGTIVIPLMIVVLVIIFIKIF